MAFSEDYSRVQPYLDKKLAKLMGKDRLVAQYDELEANLAEASKAQEGLVKIPVEMGGEGIKEWPFLLHANPLDIVAHGITKFLIDPLSTEHEISWRGPNGLHVTRDPGLQLTPLFQSAHIDSFDGIYGITNLNHFFFEGQFRNWSPTVSTIIYDYYRGGYHYVY